MKRVLRTNQGGSILTYAVVGTILVLLLAGGIYVVYQRAALVRTNEPIVGVTNPDKKTSSPSGSSSQSPSHNAATPPVDTGAQGNSTAPGGSSTSRTPNAPSAAAGTPGQIPQTGPSNAGYSAVVVLLLSLAGSYYIRSRASLRSL